MEGIWISSVWFEDPTDRTQVDAADDEVLTKPARHMEVAIIKLLTLIDINTHQDFEMFAGEMPLRKNDHGCLSANNT